MRKFDEGDSPPAVEIGRLAASCRVGKDVRVYAHEFHAGSNVQIGDGVVLVGDIVVLGDGVRIDQNCDVRAGIVEIGALSELHEGIRILVAERFVVGEAARIASGVNIVCREFVAGRLLSLGEWVTIGYGGATTSTAIIRLGNRVTVQQHSILNPTFPIDIEDDVGASPYLTIWTHGGHHGHGLLNGMRPEYAPVRIGRNVWLGFHVTVLPGVTVGENTIVAAGSVITRNIPANVLAAGIPACVRRSLKLEAIDERTTFEMTREVIKLWKRELEWKGCRVVTFYQDDHKIEMTVTLGDGKERTRVVLSDSLALDLNCQAEETLVLVVPKIQSDLEKLSRPQVCIMDLQTGSVYGTLSCIAEDLRNEMRRHLLRCGDQTCFSSIDPAPFARLRAVAADRKFRSMAN